ncbi:hypothetical protein QJS10_CPB13g00608 [Acorus calamus]|uniref:FAD-binding domain-containing protein n=1 Tax=Acorus calamus TaxID=4465 RepID=A0AAV9DHB8_ACOCL|nr:hypothetical protein QJS10_CPB13g00608 [Acorus calamus]
MLETLAEELPSEAIRFSLRLRSIKTEAVEGSSIAILRLDDGTTIKAKVGITRLSIKVLIGCDGIHSVAAQWLGLIEPVSSGRSRTRGLSVYLEGHRMRREFLSFMKERTSAGIVPPNDKEVYWYTSHNSFHGDKYILQDEFKLFVEDLVRDPESMKNLLLEKLINDFAPNLLDVIRHSESETLTWANPMYRYPWDLIVGRSAWRGCVTVAGDAMHPMTPDLGQGGCTSLEDAVVLARRIGPVLVGGGDVEGAVEGYVRERRWRLAVIAAVAYVMGLGQTRVNGWLGAFVKFVMDHTFAKVLPGAIAKIYE